MKSLTLSEDLKKLVASHPKQPIRFGQLIDASGDRAFGILFLLLSLPSALPLPATGISTPLGFAMFLLAMQMIAGRKTLWVPERVRRMKISHGTAKKMVAGLSWILKIFEKFLRPRWHWMHQKNGQRIYGLNIALLCVVMQVPIPLTNTLPAAVIFIMALALTEEDGLIGMLTNFLAVTVITAYTIGFGALFYLGFKSFDQLFEWLKNYS